MGLLKSGDMIEKISTLKEMRRRQMAFARYFNSQYTFHPDYLANWVRSLPDEVLVCRCEEVSLGDMRRAVADGFDTPRIPVLLQGNTLLKPSREGANPALFDRAPLTVAGWTWPDTERRLARTLGVQWGVNGRAAPDLGNTTGLAFPSSVQAGGRTGVTRSMCCGRLICPRVPISQMPAVWKHDSTSRGIVSVGRSAG